MGRRNRVFVYMLGNKTGAALYIGVTNDLRRRVSEHNSPNEKSFTSRYRAYRLVYYEQYESIRLAIEREKQLKRWSRRKKEKLIRTLNPEYRDLKDELIFQQN